MLSKLFPKYAGSCYTGYRIALWVYMLLAVTSTIRSLIHLILPDSGAGCIAGLDLSAGEANILFSFGLLGVSQLAYDILQLLAAFRYRNLVPLMYAIILLETAGRMWVEHAKPPVITHTPPGVIGNEIILPLAVLMFGLSLMEPPKTKKLYKYYSC